MHQGPAPAGGNQHFGRARHAVGVRILAGRIYVEAVVGVLDGGNRVAAGNQAGDDFRQQSGLPRSAPAGQSDDPHGKIYSNLVTKVAWPRIAINLSGRQYDSQWCHAPRKRVTELPSRSLLPLPACGERAGVRGRAARLRLAESHPHPDPLPLWGATGSLTLIRAMNMFLTF